MTTPMADRFTRDTKTHRLDIAHDDGLYRHLRFRAHDDQGRTHSNAWFDLITAPGTLTFVGDYDSVVFRRLPDMFEFFRRSAHKGQPNLSYWAEKVTSGGDRSVERYSEEVFRQVVGEYVAQDIRDGIAPRGIGRALAPIFASDPWEHDLTFEASARAALDEFEYEGYRFHDAWEWSFKDYTHGFKWACHAVAWGIAQYDQAKAVARATP